MATKELTVGALLKMLEDIKSDAKITFDSQCDEPNTPVIVKSMNDSEVVLDWHPDYTR